MTPPIPLRRALAAALLLGTVATAQGGPLTGPSALFSELRPVRSKTFTKSSSDPDERPQAAIRGNDDGFTGANQVEAFRRPRGPDELAVLADIEGRSGYMGLFFRNYWSGIVGLFPQSFEANRTQIIVDGTVRHDLPLPDFFRGTWDPRGQVAPFDGPFTNGRAGGFVTHTPIAWQDSFRVQCFENSFGNAARFHKVSGSLASPAGQLQVPDLAAWETVYGRIGGWRHDVPRRAHRAQLAMAASGGQDEIVLQGPATLLELRCRVADPADWRHIRARFFWDGETSPSVDVPLRLLAGRMRPPFPLNGQPQALDTLLFGHDGGRELWVYFPMHFARDASLEFVNRGPSQLQLDVEYAVHDGPHPGDWGYFTALYHRGVTQAGVTFRGPVLQDCRGLLRGLILETLLDTSGRVPPPIDLTHLEGDLLVRVNGNRGDDHTYAATETSVGKWGWYGTPSDVFFQTDTSFNHPLQVRQRRDGVLEACRVQGSTYVFDPVHFVDGIEIALEHGVQNLANADYGLVTLMYLQDGAARELVDELDVGDLADEARVGASFGSAPAFLLASPFFRDHFFATAPLTDDGREVRNWYRFNVSAPNLAGYKGICLEFRLDRQRFDDGGVTQAEILVDGNPAGLLHSWTSNERNRWKEGGELEVELPRALTDGKSSFSVEVRPVSGTEPLRIGAIRVHGYTIE